MKTLEIDIEHRVAIHHEELIGEFVENFERGSGGTAWLAVVNAPNVQTPVLLRRAKLDDLVSAVINQDQHVRETVAFGKQDLTFEQRRAADVDHRLRQVAEPFA